MQLQLTVPRKNNGIYDEKLFNRPLGCSLNKPKKGGLWSSTYDKKYGSDWIRWCNNESFWYPNHGTILIPNYDIRVFVIDKLQDLVNLLTSFKYTPKHDHYDFIFEYAFLDFEAMSKYFDAIHLTQKGEASTRFSKPTLYGWDSECVLWLNNTFKVKKIIKTKQYLKDFYERI